MKWESVLLLPVTEIQGTREPQELTTSSNLGGERVGKGWNCSLDHFEPPVGMVIKGNLWVEQFGDKCWLRCPSQECTPTAFLPGTGRLYPSVPACRAICSPVTSAGSEPKAIWVYTPMVSAYFHQVCPLPKPLAFFLSVHSWCLFLVPSATPVFLETQISPHLFLERFLPDFSSLSKSNHLLLILLWPVSVFSSLSRVLTSIFFALLLCAQTPCMWCQCYSCLGT